MSVLVGRDTRVLTQGITGSTGQLHTRLCREYGTQMVAGVTPGRGGTDFEGIPIFCTSCGSAVLIRHPAMGMTDVPAGSVVGFAYKPTVHVNYGEKVLSMRDGLPKFKDFPKDFGGSGEMLSE